MMDIILKISLDLIIYILDCFKVIFRKTVTYVIKNSKRNEKKINGITYYSYYKRNLTESVSYGNYFIELQEAAYFFTKNLIIYKNNKTGKEKKLNVIFNPTEMAKIFCHGDNTFCRFLKKKNFEVL